VWPQQTDCPVNQIDPYRLDKPAGHRDGAWLAEQLDRAVGVGRRIHWRGLHYAIVASGNIRKPNGELYHNDDADWTRLASCAGKAARWFGYIDFERITDNRNSGPVVHRKARLIPETWVSVGLDVTIPDIDDAEPCACVTGFQGRQPYALSMFGEKTSPEDVLLAIARRFEADLYLAAGEISDSLLYRMAKDGAEDGRTMVVLVLADCDPAGRQMAVSIGRKLQALRDLRFPSLKFEVAPVALSVEQVRQLELPSTPLKETERRAGRRRSRRSVTRSTKSRWLWLTNARPSASATWKPRSSPSTCNSRRSPTVSLSCRRWSFPSLRLMRNMQGKPPSFRRNGPGPGRPKRS
jgi:hypothetical protein